MVEQEVLTQLVARTAEALTRRRYLPEATYRIQLNAHFRFRDAQAIAPYLHDLGVTTCYASPYLKARPGSMHGYDITDHRQLNPEIGTEQEHADWIKALQDNGLGQVLDVVPNHMGIVGNENVWWNDVLENGRSSPYAAFFDIDWHGNKPDLYDKVLLPILGDPYGKVLENGQLQLRFDNGAFRVDYFEHRFPISPSTYGQVLGQRIDALTEELGKDNEAVIELQSVLTAISHLPPDTATGPAQIAERQREKEVIKRRLGALVAGAPAVRQFVERTIERFNGQAHEGNGAPYPHVFDLLDELLSAQPYRLAWWRVASDEINFRRFFDINELAALSMEKPEVFAAAHELILRLLRTGMVQGLRIDHPDGLYDPGQYLRRLQLHYALEVARDVASSDPAFAGLNWAEVEGPLAEAIEASWGKRATSQEEVGGPPAPPQDGESLFRRPLYVVVEKILAPNELLPEDWPVYGTTGYEFLEALNALLVDHDHGPAFTRLYRRWAHTETSFRDLVYQKKYLILQVALSSELQVLAVQLDRLSEKNRWSRDFTLNSLRRALREIIACFEVYRPYITSPEVTPRDRRYVERAVAEAKRRNPAISGALFDFVRDMLLVANEYLVTGPDRDAVLRFVGKFQQVTSPVMAKGLEDTAFYIYNRLISLNEVGGDPQQFGMSVPTFHRRNHARQVRFPHALSATSTHDTKRGEDARARIAVLSEMPRLWSQALSRWSRLNKRHRAVRAEEPIPGRNAEYFLYQTLIGAWPLGPQTPEVMSSFLERLQAYALKAVHEAKVHTSWINPNPVYDEAIRQFVAAILDEEKNQRFLEDFRAVQKRIDHYGLFNSLCQTLLKVTSPGAPDVYQGTELWDFSFVDPDNRRPVDYELRRRILAELREKAAAGPKAKAALCRELVESRADGRIKMYLLTQALHLRCDNPGLFSTGEYLPAHASPGRDNNICAFVRRQAERQALVVAPRLLTRVVAPGVLPLADAWGDEVLYLPEGITARRWQDVFTGQELEASEREGKLCLMLAGVFAHFPIALLTV